MRPGGPGKRGVRCDQSSPQSFGQRDVSRIVCPEVVANIEHSHQQRPVPVPDEREAEEADDRLASSTRVQHLSI